MLDITILICKNKVTYKVSASKDLSEPVSPHCAAFSLVFKGFF